MEGPERSALKFVESRRRRIRRVLAAPLLKRGEHQCVFRGEIERNLTDPLKTPDPSHEVGGAGSPESTARPADIDSAANTRTTRRRRRFVSERILRRTTALKDGPRRNSRANCSGPSRPGGGARLAVMFQVGARHAKGPNGRRWTLPGGRSPMQAAPGPVTGLSVLPFRLCRWLLMIGADGNCGGGWHICGIETGWVLPMAYRFDARGGFGRRRGCARQGPRGPCGQGIVGGVRGPGRGRSASQRHRRLLRPGSTILVGRSSSPFRRTRETPCRGNSQAAIRCVGAARPIAGWYCLLVELL